MVVTSSEADCVLDGSKHVQDLKLNDRYNLDVRIAIDWTPTTLSADGNITVEARVAPDYYAPLLKNNLQRSPANPDQMDIPFPFSLTPKPIMTGIFDVAMSATLGIIMVIILASELRLAGIDLVFHAVNISKRARGGLQQMGHEVTSPSRLAFKNNYQTNKNNYQNIQTCLCWAGPGLWGELDPEPLISNMHPDIRGQLKFESISIFNAR